MVGTGGQCRPGLGSGGVSQVESGCQYLALGQVSFQSSGVPVCIQVQLYLEEDGDYGPLHRSGL